MRLRSTLAVLACLVCAGSTALGVSLAGAASPVVTIEAPSAVRYTTAHVAGEVDPEDHETFFHFEYATQAQFEATEWAEASRAGFGSVAENEPPTPVEAELAGLAPSTTYHLRLVAENGDGERAEAIAPGTFATEAVQKPDASIEPITSFTATTAQLVGHVNPNAPKPEGSTDAAEAAAFETYWRFECVAPGPACGSFGGAPLPADNTAHGVSAEATGLQPNTEYHVALIAENGGGQEASGTQILTTPAIGPTVATGTNTPEGQGKVLIRGYVNPHNDQVTSCEFLWGATEDYGQSAPCEGEPGAAGEPIEVTAKLSGLEAGKSFHFALVAGNEAGGEESEDGVFATLEAPEPEGACPNEARREEQHSTFLPDCRAYEMVSPPEKHGDDVMARPTRTRAAEVGDAVQFTSLGAFADAHGTGIATEYISERVGAPGTNGWSSHSIFPKLESLSLNAAIVELDSAYQGELSADLSTGIFRTFTNLSGDPLVKGVAGLYRRTDLLSAGEGSYQPITPCPLCHQTDMPLGLSLSAPLPWVAATSSDLSQVLIESASNYVSGATGDGPKIYRWGDDQLRFEGMVPAEGETECGGEGTPDCVTAPRSIAGPGASLRLYSFHTMSNDGSKIFFTVPESDYEQTGPIYMRSNHTTTVQINASERTDCAETTGSCTGKPSPDPHGPRPALYETATPDGSRVFFRSTEQLTDVQSGGIYMYNSDKAASDPHNLTLISQGARGDSDLRVVGVGGDGAYVYFTASGQLLPDVPRTSAAALYLWHEGKTSYIGSLETGGDGSEIGIDSHPWGLSSLASRVTPDGKHLLFVAHRGGGLTGYDHGSGCPTEEGSCTELYLYDAPSDRLSCASCNPSGAQATSDAQFTLEQGAGGSRSSTHLTHPLSLDGRYVFFTSGEPLSAKDTNGATDVYRYDALLGQVSLITSGDSPTNSYFLDASPDGHDIYFADRQHLVGWDQDNSADLYDARIGGGFAEPASPAGECIGEGCRGLTSAPTSLPTPASASFNGPDDRVAKRHHRHATKHRKHKRKHRHHHPKESAR